MKITFVEFSNAGHAGSPVFVVLQQITSVYTEGGMKDDVVICCGRTKCTVVGPIKNVMAKLRGAKQVEHDHKKKLWEKSESDRIRCEQDARNACR